MGSSRSSASIQSEDRQLSEMMRARGVEVAHSTLSRWVQKYGPELNKRCPLGSQSPTAGNPPTALSHRPHLKPTNDSWRVDETYIKVKGKDRYLYWAVDSDGNANPPSEERVQTLLRLFFGLFADSARGMPKQRNGFSTKLCRQLILKNQE